VAFLGRSYPEASYKRYENRNNLRPPLYRLKFSVPVSAALMLLQQGSDQASYLCGMRVAPLIVRVARSINK
jgi:hypothetical protein